MCDEATQSQQRTKNLKKCWEMPGEPDATAKPVLAIYTTTFKVLVQEIKTASRPLCEATTQSQKWYPEKAGIS